MKKNHLRSSNYTETQIVAILKQYEGGREAMDVCREYGISKATLFNWRKKYNGMEATHLKELKALQEENRRLKQMKPMSEGIRLLMDQLGSTSLNYRLAKEIIEKTVKPSA